MKKAIYILSALLLGLVSCNKAEFESFESRKTEETGLVEVTMQLQVPKTLQATTKANLRAELPQIDYIRVAVFGTSGYPQAYAYAEPVSGENQATAKYADRNNSVFYFKVLLPVYEGEAHVHIIANGDENIQFVDMTEDKLMTSMKTTGNVGAYWARVVLPDGILTIKDENGIMQTTQQGNFIPSAETAHLFKELVLVRNFAEVTLFNEASNLKIESWTLVNTPTSGSVAPVSGWEEKFEDGEPVDEDEDGVTDLQAIYVDDYKDYIFNTQDGTMIFLERDPNTGVVTDTLIYEGYMTAPGHDGINIAIPAEDTWVEWPDNADSTYSFLYERVYPDEKWKPTCVLIKGYYNNETTPCYYRVDLMDENLGGYFPIYRNYNYKITIGEVGNRGAADAATAMLRDSGGNVSMTAEAQTLTDISDGKSRLYVEYVDRTFVTGTQTVEKTFWVYYVPDVKVKYQTDGEDENGVYHKAGDPVIDNTKITTVKVLKQGDALVSGGTITLDATKSKDTGFYTYKFTLNKQVDKDLESEFYVEANNTFSDGKKSKLVREIKVRVMKKMSMSLSLEPNPTEGDANAKTVLHIALSDTLQQSMFPLEFHIEDVNHTLNPTGKDDSSLGIAAKTIEVPVKTAKSIADGTTNSFYFIRTVNWSEYKTMRDQWVTAKKNGATPEELATIIDFRTEFKTLVSNSSTTVYVENEYFTTGSTELLQPDVIIHHEVAMFDYSDFSSGNNSSATDGPITVNFSRIDQIQYQLIRLNNGNSRTITFTPTSSATMMNVKITGVSIKFYSASYNPSSITGPFEGGTGNSAEATYNGDPTTSAFSATLNTRNNQYCYISSISVQYSYAADE